ncbi:retrovirus-related pol polyprotein from transposon TNT 1-94 [Tanacetum coccineum]
MWCFFNEFLTHVEPKTYKQALEHSCWIEAMQEEIHEFERLDVWILVPCPDNILIIPLKWIFKIKLDEYGDVLKNKARLVSKVYRHELVLIIEESFAPFARLEAIRLFIVLASSMNNGPIFHMDVKPLPQRRTERSYLCQSTRRICRSRAYHRMLPPQESLSIDSNKLQERGMTTTAFLIKSGLQKAWSILHSSREKQATSSTDVDDGTNLPIFRITSFQNPEASFINQSKYARNLKKLVFTPEHSQACGIRRTPALTKSFQMLTRQDDKPHGDLLLVPTHFLEHRLVSCHPKSRKVPPSSTTELNTIALSGCCANTKTPQAKHSVNHTKKVWKATRNHNVNTTKTAWRPTRKVVGSVKPQWKPTGRYFALYDNCPLTRIMEPIVEPLELTPSVSSSSKVTMISRSKGRTVADSIAERLTRPTAYKFKTDCSIIPVWVF